MKTTLLILVLALAMNASAQFDKQSIRAGKINPLKIKQSTTTIHRPKFTNSIITPPKSLSGSRALIQQYDSILYWNSEQTGAELKLGYRDDEFQYENQLLKRYLEKQVIDDSWVEDMEYKFSYDANNRLIKEEASVFEDGVWYPSSRWLYEYDENGNQTSYTTELYDTDQWVVYYIETITYNDQNLYDTFQYEYPNNGSAYLYHYTYNSNNQIDSVYAQSKDNDEWTNYLLFDYDYDDNDLEINRYVQTWNPFTNEWADYVHLISEYDDNNNVIVQTRKEFGTEWANYSRYLMEYNNNNLITSETYQIWEDGQWINEINIYGREEWTYDDLNNVLSSTSKKWTGQEWINSWQTTYQYDVANFNVSDAYRQWDDNGSIIDADSTHYYFYTVVGMPDNNGNSNSNLSLLPNPSSGQFKIESIEQIESVDILNMGGKVIYSQNVSGTKSITLNVSLPSGQYIIRAKTIDGVLTTGKIFIIK